jgi:Fic family protein
VESSKRQTRCRAGVYTNQRGGYKAFIPSALPPDPPIQFDAEMIQLLTKAERALGRLDGASGILPNVDLFVAMYVNKEAVLSSQIEGTQASLIDVLAFEADAAIPENPQDIEEVVNYINAVNFGLTSHIFLKCIDQSITTIYKKCATMEIGNRGSSSS